MTFSPARFTRMKPRRESIFSAARCGLVITVALVAAIHTDTSPTSAQGQSVAVRVDMPRPLAPLLTKAQVLYRRVVTFEEAPIEHAQDLVDISAPDLASGAKPTRTPRFVPRGGPLSVFLPDPAKGDVDVERAVRELVAEFNASGYPGQYRVIASDDTLHVVPIASKGVSGTRIARRSLFDREVVVTTGRYAGSVLLQIVLDQLNEQQEFPIGIATVSTSALDSTVLHVQGGRYVARDLLLRINAESLSPISWTMLFEPMARRYYMNIQGIELDPYSIYTGDVR